MDFLSELLINSFNIGKIKTTATILGSKSYLTIIEKYKKANSDIDFETPYLRGASNALIHNTIILLKKILRYQLVIGAPF